MENGKNIITTKGLKKFYYTDEIETTALNNVNLAIGEGEFVAIMGPSGCGKSTLLNIVGLLDNPSEGEFFFYDEEVSKYSERQRAELRKKNIGFVFQSFNLIDELTVYENVELPLIYLKYPAADRKKRVEEVLETMQIMHRKDHFPQQLSGGQQQRVALARAIIRQPKLFLLDEPLSNLDAKLRLDMRLELHKLQKSLDTTTVYVTHDQEEAMTLADRIAIFMDGKIVQIGTPREIFVTPATAAVAGFIGTPPMNLLPGNWLGTSVNVNGSHMQVSDETNKSCAVILGVRPNDISIIQDGIPVIVERVEDLGDSTITSFRDAKGTLIKMKKESESTVNEGESVTLGFSPKVAHLFDASSGNRI